MRVVVTGATGFVGSHLARLLVQRGHRVLAWVRDRARTSRLRDLANQIEVCDVALDDPSAVARTISAYQADVVVHSAWYAVPRDYLESEQNLVSLATTAAFLQAAFRAGCGRAIGIGTCLEYAPGETAHRETDPLEPVSLYASCKASAWHVGRALARRYGARLVWARLFHLHGPDEHPDRLLSWAVRELQAGRTLEVSGGAQVRDHLDVRDAASALATLVENEEGIGAVNVCSGIALTLCELLTTLAEMQERGAAVHFGARPYAPDEIMHLCGDPGLLKALGWKPTRTDLRASLGELIAAAGACSLEEL